MKSFAPTATRDFLGFLDGLQAQNLAAIEREVELPLSEMQTRLSALRRHWGAAPTEAQDLLAGADAALRARDGSVIENLVQSGQTVQKLILNHPTCLSEDSFALNQIVGFSRALVGAARASRDGRVTEVALALATILREAGLVFPIVSVA